MSDTKFEVDKEKLEVRINREFNASPEKLWAAHTKPELIKKWWADTDIDQFDLRVGGKWRFVSGQNQAGQDNAFRGEFKEIDEPHKIVRTFEYEPFAGSIMLETVLLEPVAGGKTLQTTISKYQNLQALEGMVGMGMERGAVSGLDRLAKVVEA